MLDAKVQEKIQRSVARAEKKAAMSGKNLFKAQKQKFYHDKDVEKKLEFGKFIEETPEYQDYFADETSSQSDDQHPNMSRSGIQQVTSPPI